MADLIKIKRSTGSAAPGSLAQGELGYTEGATGKLLYVGLAAGLEVVGGKGLWDQAQSVVVTKSSARTPESIALGASSLLGRGSSGDVAAITLGTGLSMSGAVLSASAVVPSTFDYKASVRAASTANVVIATALENADTLDGVTLATGDRVLLKNQTTGAENGIYVVAASGAASRAADAAVSADVTAGMFVAVTEGTVNADTAWLLTTNDPIVLGTDALVFTAFPTVITAGGGLLATGSTIDVVTADTSIVVNADSIQAGINTTGGLEVSSGIRVKLPANSGLVRDTNGLAVGAGTGVTVSGTTVAIGQAVGTGSSVTFANVTDSALTAGRVVFAGTAGLLSDDAGMTYNAGTDTLTVAVLDGCTIDGGSF